MADFNSAAALGASGPKPLATLLAAGDESAGLWSPEEMAAIFRHQMAAPLAVDLAEPPAGEAPAQSFSELLRQTRPAVALLEVVKDFAKTNADHPESGLPKEVAAVLYYACIGAALVRLGTRISKLTDAELRRGLGWAAGQPWVDEETRRLLAEALAKVAPGGPGKGSAS